LSGSPVASLILTYSSKTGRGDEDFFKLVISAVHFSNAKLGYISLRCDSYPAGEPPGHVDDLSICVHDLIETALTGVL